MRWPWTKDVAEQREAIAASEERRNVIESNWDFIRAQVAQARKHRAENHITDLIVGVARGKKREA